MKKGIMTVMSVICVLGFIGCATYSHTQAVRNETGYTVKEVYIRDTGTTDWGTAKNVQLSTNSYGYSYWATTDMNNATQIVFFDGGYSETPKAIGNKDIAIIDSNGLIYMKNNVPITFTTTKSKHMFDFQGETLTTSTPITFTAQDKLPILYVVNQTGYPVTLIAPIQKSINDKERIQFQPMEMNRSIDVIYTIGQAKYTEQVTMNNRDATVTLTKKPPTLTIVNNVGATINMLFLRIPNSPNWVGGNIVIREGTVSLAEAGKAQTGDISGSIVNKDKLAIWLGRVDIAGSILDIRIDDVQGSSYVKSNVQIPNNDMTLTFTQADKR